MGAPAAPGVGVGSGVSNAGLRGDWTAGSVESASDPKGGSVGIERGLAVGRGGRLHGVRAGARPGGSAFAAACSVGVGATADAAIGAALRVGKLSGGRLLPPKMGRPTGTLPSLIDGWGAPMKELARLKPVPDAGGEG
ncbi:MAG: hypothetical protein M5U21_07390 [Fimbriimonadaceae bacterium]|nr:hypothetical protein [Fimbriimonadaceae bacterium]